MSTRRPSARLLVAGALALAVALAVLVAPLASDAPDGLERVAAEHGIAAGERAHPLADGPLAGYELSGASRSGGTARTAVAGVIGVACCFLATAGLAAVRRRGATARAVDGDTTVAVPVADAGPRP
jgi:hypothetical protein